MHLLSFNRSCSIKVEAESKFIEPDNIMSTKVE